jgi:iron-sulfur cluster assembly accessory protein
MSEVAAVGEEASADAAGAMPADQSGNPIVITEKAVEMVKKALAEEGISGHGLRVAVRGGGCSGLEYSLDFSETSRAGDTVFEVSGLKIFIDMASAQYLKGTEIDYVSGLNGTGFKFNNPNATRTCGCGSSFS